MALTHFGLSVIPVQRLQSGVLHPGFVVANSFQPSVFSTGRTHHFPTPKLVNSSTAKSFDQIPNAQLAAPGRSKGRTAAFSSLQVFAALTSGDQLPELGPLETDESTAGAVQNISLNDVVKDSAVVLFVYPKADTSGCTKQACAFEDFSDEFEGLGYKIFGLSADSPADQATWKEKQGYNYPLLSDPSHQALKSLGVSDGSQITRSHFVVEKGGKIKDARIGISSGNSVPEALKTVKA